MLHLVFGIRVGSAMLKAFAVAVVGGILSLLALTRIVTIAVHFDRNHKTPHERSHSQYYVHSQNHNIINTSHILVPNSTLSFLSYTYDQNSTPKHIFIFFPLSHPSHFTFFFFNDTATTEIYTLSLHDALPI